MNTKATCRALIACAALIVVGCAGRQPGARPTQIREGLYAVAARECDPVADEENHCGLIRYLELVRGRFHGVAQDELALVEWSVVAAGATDYIYNARPLRGAMDGARKYVIEELNDGQHAVKEWVAVEDGVATSYQFEKRSVAGSSPTSHVVLQLTPAVRDEQLNRLLAYPEPVADE